MFFYTNNRQQNKLVNMVNGNDLLQHNYWTYIFDLCFLNPDVCILKSEWYLDFHIAYIFLNERILQTFLKMYLSWVEI